MASARSPSSDTTASSPGKETHDHSKSGHGDTNVATQIESIASLYDLSLLGFSQILQLLREDPVPDEFKRSDVQDQLGRFRIWAGNHGAHRKPTDPLSLDHRLREEISLHHGVRNRLRKIEALGDAKNILASSFDESRTPSESSESSETSSVRAFINELKAESTTTDLREAFLDIEQAISSLYKYFITLQRRPQPDRHLRAAKLDMSIYEELDYHITNTTFPECSDQKFLERLAKANTQRRRLFWYRRKHQEKIMNYSERPVLKIPAPEEKPKQAPRGDEISVNIRRRSIYTEMTKMTKMTEETRASTFIKRPAAPRSESGRTQYTLQSSVSNQKAQICSIPPPPNAEKALSGVPFLCPFYFSSIELKNGKQDWEYHAYCDMKPYICTSNLCTASEQLFETFGDWKNHETTFHWREWQCKDCSDTFTDKEEFLLHAGRTHEINFHLANEANAIAALCERPIHDRSCFLCSETNIDSVDGLLKHIGRHMRQLAISSLPPVYDDGEESDGGCASVASRNANLAMTGSSVTEDSRASLLQEPRLQWKEEDLDFTLTAEYDVSDDEREENWNFIARMNSSDGEDRPNMSKGSKCSPRASLLSKLAKNERKTKMQDEENNFFKADFRDSIDSGLDDRSSGTGVAADIILGPPRATFKGKATSTENDELVDFKQQPSSLHGLVLYDFTAEKPDELTAKAGEIMSLLARSNSEWIVAQPSGKGRGPGLIPTSYVEVIVEIRDGNMTKAISKREENFYLGFLPTVEKWKEQNANLNVHASQSSPTPLEYNADSGPDLYYPISASVPRYCFAEDKYWFVVEATLQDVRSWELSRYYEDFNYFQIALLERFPEEAGHQGDRRILPYMPGPVSYATDPITEGRREKFDVYIKALLRLPTYISQCRLVKKFFAPREGDLEIDTRELPLEEQEDIGKRERYPQSETPPTRSGPLPPIPSALAAEVQPPEKEYPYRAKAIYSYETNPDNPHEISLSKHDILEIRDPEPRWWQARREDGKTGIVPSNHVLLI